MTVLVGNQTVPDQMIGCWLRKYIRFKDGSVDDSTHVIWLQTASGMGDMRISAERAIFRGQSSFADCSDRELISLAEQDCACAVTHFDETTSPYPTASWEIGDSGFMQQTVVNYPEDGWFEWKENGNCMMEYAPSGHYTEDWRLQPNSHTDALHLVCEDSQTTTNLYIAGAHAILTVDRSVILNDERPLQEIVEANLSKKETIYSYLDTEYSYAKKVNESDYEITLSSLPWREGDILKLDWLPSSGHSLDNVKDNKGSNWNVVSLWSA